MLTKAQIEEMKAGWMGLDPGDANMLTNRKVKEVLFLLDTVAQLTLDRDFWREHSNTAAKRIRDLEKQLEEAREDIREIHKEMQDWK